MKSIWIVYTHFVGRAPRAPSALRRWSRDVFATDFVIWIFDLQLLTQFLIDCLEIWTTHSPTCNLNVWCIINSNIVLFQIHVFGLLSRVSFVNQTVLACAEHNGLTWYCECINLSNIFKCSEILYNLVNISLLQSG